MDNNSYFWSNCPIACSGVVCNCGGDLMLIPLIRLQLCQQHSGGREQSKMFHYHKLPINVPCTSMLQHFFPDKNSFLFIRNIAKNAHHIHLSCHLNRAEGEIVAINDTWDCTELIDHQLPRAGDQASDVGDTGGTWASVRLIRCPAQLARRRHGHCDYLAN